MQLTVGMFVFSVCLCAFPAVEFVWSVPYSWKHAHFVVRTSRHESDSFPTCPDISFNNPWYGLPPQASILSSPFCLRDQHDQSNRNAVSGLDTVAWTFQALQGWINQSLHKAGGKRNTTLLHSKETPIRVLKYFFFFLFFFEVCNHNFQEQMSCEKIHLLLICLSSHLALIQFVCLFRCVKYICDFSQFNYKPHTTTVSHLFPLNVNACLRIPLFLSFRLDCTWICSWLIAPHSDCKCLDESRHRFFL